MNAERVAMTLERQAFEKWADGQYYNLHTMPDGRYESLLMQNVWEGWQAAIANLSRAAEPVYQVRYMIMGSEKEWFEVCRGDFEKLAAFRCDDIVTQERRILYTHPPEPARDAKCKWSQDVDGNWETDCGNLHILIDGTPYDNEMGFCCYCGHAIDQVLYHDAAMAQESGNGK